MYEFSITARRPIQLSQQEISDPNHKRTGGTIQYALHGPITETPIEHVPMQKQAPTSKPSGIHLRQETLHQFDTMSVTETRITSQRGGNLVHSLPPEVKQQLFKCLDKEHPSSRRIIPISSCGVMLFLIKDVTGGSLLCLLGFLWNGMLMKHFGRVAIHLRQC